MPYDLIFFKLVLIYLLMYFNGTKLLVHITSAIHICGELKSAVRRMFFPPPFVSSQTDLIISMPFAVSLHFKTNENNAG
jgi:hypothetical protein